MLLALAPLDEPKHIASPPEMGSMLARPSLAIDHVAMIVPARKASATRKRFAECGLIESSTSRHVGQGTANVFYCFDNLFLELLWVENTDEANAPGNRRLGLVDRAASNETGALPFAIAVRTIPADAVIPFPSWPFEPAGSTGMHPTHVAVSSDDHAQPLLFRAQRDRPPLDWTDGRSGRRQLAAGIFPCEQGCPCAWRYSHPQ